MAAPKTNRNAKVMDKAKILRAHIDSLMRATMKATAYRYEARDLERFAANIARLIEHGERWAKVGDKEMARTYAKDARDLQAIYDAVEQGDYSKATRLARRLDTVVRDEIPVRLYNAIHQG